MIRLWFNSIFFCSIFDFQPKPANKPNKKNENIVKITEMYLINFSFVCFARKKQQQHTTYNHIILIITILFKSLNKMTKKKDFMIDDYMMVYDLFMLH